MITIQKGFSSNTNTLILTRMSTAFPRGGSEVDTKANNSKNVANIKIRDFKQDENLFGSKRAMPIDDPRVKKKKKIQDLRSLAPTSSPAVGLGNMKMTGNDKTSKIESLSFAKYGAGTMFIGYVLQITDDSLIISLPGGFTGKVSVREISDVYFQQNSEHSAEAIKSMFYLQQPLRCVCISQNVSRLEDKHSKERKSLLLSLRGSILHRTLGIKNFQPGSGIFACVISIEDNGYVMSVGIAGVTAFLPLKGLAAGHPPLVIGQPIECVVDTVNDIAHTISLRAHKKSVSEALVRSPKLAFHQLIPGMLIHTVVQKIVQNGLVVQFMDIFHGMIEFSNLWAPAPTEQWQKRVAVGDTVLARIIFIDHGAKIVHFSLRPHVVEFRPPKLLPDLGASLSDLSIVHVHKKSGIILRQGGDNVDEEDAPVEAAGEDGVAAKRKGQTRKELALREKLRRERDEGVLGVVIKRKALYHQECPSAALDKEGIPVEKMDKLFRVGDALHGEARVLGFHLVEGWVLASNLPEYTEGQIIHSSSIQVGQLVDAEVTGVRNFGLVVKLGGKVKGICPLVHLTDMGLSIKPTKKFKVGQKMKMRVWEAIDSHLVLTNKKAIIEDPNPIISDYDGVTEGAITHGVVSQVRSDGLRIHFFNKVIGRIPSSVLVKQGVTDPEDSYRVGQVLRCVVLKKVIPKEYKGKDKDIKSTHPSLILGLDIGDTSSILRDSQSTTGALDGTTASEISRKEGPQIFVSGTVMKLDGENLSVRLDDGRVAVLSKFQASDLAVTSELLVTSSPDFAPGAKIKNAFILGTHKGTIQITMKPLLLLAALNTTSAPTISGDDSSSSPTLLSHRLGSDRHDIVLPSRVADLAAGQLVAGYITKIESFGVIVKFRDNLTALAPRPNVADKFISSPVGLFHVGDSIQCVVQRVELEKERVIVTFKSAFVPPSKGDYCYLHSLLREHYLATVLKRVDESSSGTAPNWKVYTLGSIINATVLYLKDYGVVLVAPDQTSMILVSLEHKHGDVEVGASLEIRLLDVDFENKVLEASLDPSLLQIQPKPGKENKKRKKDNKEAVASRPVIAPGQRVDVRVEIVKEKYLVVSCDGHIGFVMISDYHNPYLTTEDYHLHQIIHAQVERCPNAHKLNASSYPHETCILFSIFKGNDEQRNQVVRLQREAEESDAKLLATLESSKNGEGLSSSLHTSNSRLITTKQKFLESVHYGSIIRCHIKEITPLRMTLVPDGIDSKEFGVQAVVHLTGAIDRADGFDDLEGTLDKRIAEKASGNSDNNTITSGHPFFGHRIGESLSCTVLQIRKHPRGSQSDNEDDGDIEQAKSDRVQDRNDAEEYLLYVAIAPSKSKPLSRDKLRPLVQWRGQGKIKSHSLYAVVVTEIEDTHCTVALSPYISCRLSYVDVSKDISMIKKMKANCFVGLRVVVVVLDVVDAPGKPKQILLNRSSVEKLITGSDSVIVGKGVALADEDLKRQSKLKPGALAPCIIDLKAKHIPRPPAITITLAEGNLGRICVTELADPDSWKDLASFFNAEDSDFSDESKLKLPNGFSHGKVMKCRILSLSKTEEKTKTKSSLIEASLRPSRTVRGYAVLLFSLTLNATTVHQKSGQSAGVTTAADAFPAEGDLVSAYVAQTSSHGCFLRLSRELTGRVFVKDLSDDFVEHPAKSFPVGKLVKARVLSVAETENSARLSLKPSVVDGDAIEKELSELEIGSVVTGTVKKIEHFGVFVALQGTQLVGLSRKAMAAPMRVTDLHDAFEVGDVVRAKILGVTGHKISLGLKPSYFGEEEDEEDEDEVEAQSDDEEQEEEPAEEPEEGDKEGEATGEDDQQVQGYGSEEDGSEGEQEKGDSYLVPVDDSDDEEVNALIRSAALVEDDDVEDVEEEVQSRKKRKQNKEELVSQLKPKKSMESLPSKTTSRRAVVAVAAETTEEDSEDEEESGGGGVFSLGHRKSAGGSGAAAASSFFEWDNFKPAQAVEGSRPPNESQDSEDDDDDEEGGSEEEAANSTQKKRGRNKDAVQRKSERDILRREMELARGTLVPETADDFDRLVLAEPNSSLVWIKYMSFHLMAADIEAARAVSERALRTIGFREEDEKYNIWVARLNLEFKYGTTENLQAVFQRAVTESKGKYLYLNLATVYEQAEDTVGATAVYEQALKKYKKSKKVWMAYQHFCLRVGDSQKSKQLLARSLQSLSRHKHIEVTMRYASQEYECGDPERGRDVFEELVRNFPKRTDLWHVWVDKEIKVGNIASARRLFERMEGLRANTKNMQTIFKKHLAFEVKHGDESTQNLVKERAKEYVNSLM